MQRNEMAIHLKILHRWSLTAKKIISSNQLTHYKLEPLKLLGGSICQIEIWYLFELSLVWVKNMNKSFILCPICGNKTRVKIRSDTILKNFILYCPKCKKETLIDVKQMNIFVIREPDAKTQSR